MTFKIKDGIRINAVDVFNNSGVLTVNAPTATTLETSRIIQLSGDASGSVSFDGSADIDIAVTIGALSDGRFVGDLVGDVYATDGTTKILESGTNGTDSVFTGSVTGNADTATTATTATALETSRIIQLSGEASGSATFDGSENIDIAVTINGLTQPGDAGTQTFDSNLVGDVFADNAVNKILENGTDGTDAVFTGSVTGNADTATTATTATTLETSRIIQLSGEASGSATFDGSENIDIAVTISALSGGRFVGDLVGDVYATDGTTKILESGTNGTDSVFTGSVTGNADTADSWSTTRTVTFATGDVTGSFSTNGSADVGNVDLTIADGSVTNTALVNDSVTIGSTEITLGSAETSINGLVQFDVGNLRISGNEISSTNVDGVIAFVPNGTGSISASNSRIINVSTPTNIKDAANKEYVDAVAQGLNIKPAVRAATVANLVATYDNGTNGQGATLTSTSNGLLPDIDDVTSWVVNDSVLVKEQTSAVENGRYVITQLGNGSTPWILTRFTGADQSEEIPGMFVFVQEGTLFNATGWVAYVDPFPMVIGTDDIEIVQFSGAGEYTAGNGLSINGQEFNVNVDDSSIEIFSDILRVKDNGITNAMLVNDHYTVSTNGTGADFDISLGDTFNFNGGDGIEVAIGSDTITITSVPDGNNAFENISATISTVSPTVIDTFALATSRSVKYYIQISQGINFQISEMIVIHNGTVTYDTEFAVLKTNSELGTLTTAVNSTNGELSITMNDAAEATIKIKKMAFAV